MDGNPDDDQLTRAQCDGSAFEPLVRRHSAALHAYFARRAPAAADDLLAELWLQAYSARRGFDPARGPARAWLFGVARNVLAGHWRRTSQERASGPHSDIVGDPWQAVDHRLDAAAAGPELRRAIGDLPPAERELLLLVAWEELSPTEAAAVTGIPAGTARSRLYRARTRLREALSLSLHGMTKENR
ncbi:RNA polymerase sigma factor [Streptomyces sp. NPDC057375]|uniref:RNA polymerase sigma factor n=1 Tax=Streptomyces sp. NPDC057375 TaxID=3346109 RepID=UPI00362BE52B